MDLKKWTQRAILIFSITYTSKMIFKYIARNKSTKTRKEVNEVIMLSADDYYLEDSKYSGNLVTRSTARLFFFMNSPRHTLDVCMYAVSNQDIIECLIKLQLRGVKVRLIVDASMILTGGESCLDNLLKAGVCIVSKISNSLMHHKFCLLDASSDDVTVTPLVIAGSCNFTNKGLLGNWEDITVTSQKSLVEPYKVEFERLWVLYS